MNSKVIMEGYDTIINYLFHIFKVSKKFLYEGFVLKIVNCFMIVVLLMVGGWTSTGKFPKMRCLYLGSLPHDRRMNTSCACDPRVMLTSYPARQPIPWLVTNDKTTQ